MTAEARAEAIIAEAWQRRRWAPADLKTRRKGDPAKATLAGRLRAEATLTVAWFAGRLQMGTRDHRNRLLYRLRKAGGK